MTLVDKKGLLHYPLNQYVFLLLLSTLLNLYSNQYIGIIIMLDKVFNFEIEEAKKSYEVYDNFLKFTEDLRKFINSHQYIQGFQISTSEFYQGDKKVLLNLEEYIKLLEEKKEVKVNIFRQNSNNICDIQTNTQNFEKIEERSSLLKKICDFDDFNEEELKLVEAEEPIKNVSSYIFFTIILKIKKDKEKIKLEINKNASSRKNDLEIRANILLEYENEDKRCSPQKPLKPQLKEFKFSFTQNDKISLKDFDCFLNNYSKDYKDVDLTQYNSNVFELQVKPTIEEKLLKKFTNENMFIDEDTDFVIFDNFDEKIFMEMKNGYSKDFKFHRNYKISKDDDDFEKIEEKKINFNKY